MQKSVENLRREIGLFALTLTGLGSIIGSGWLFGAWKAAKVAWCAILNIPTARL